MMNWKERQDWLKEKYPLTVVMDRYNGTYSGAKFLAFPLDFDEVPEDVNGDDTECAYFWKNYEEPVGKGASAQDAKDDLVAQMVAESETEDDRMIRRLQDFLASYGADFFGNNEWQKYDAWLEKQKEQKPEVKDPFGDKQFRRGYNAGVADAYRDIYKKVQEVHDKMERAIIDCPDYGIKIAACNSPIMTHEMIMDEKQKEQQPAEWSKEDERRFISCMGRLQTADGTPTINSNWFEEHCYKHPSWKPSEAQMNELRGAIIPGYGYDCDVLQGLYADLKKLMEE